MKTIITSIMLFSSKHSWHMITKSNILSHKFAVFIVQIHDSKLNDRVLSFSLFTPKVTTIEISSDHIKSYIEDLMYMLCC